MKNINASEPRAAFSHFSFDFGQRGARSVAAGTKRNNHHIVKRLGLYYRLRFTP